MKTIILEYGTGIMAIVLGGVLFPLLGKLFFGTEGVLSGLIQLVLEGGV